MVSNEKLFLDIFLLNYQSSVDKSKIGSYNKTIQTTVVVYKSGGKDGGKTF